MDNNDSRNKKVVAVAKKTEGIGLILVRHTHHGRLLQKMMEDYSVPSVFLSGPVSVSKRNEYIEKLRVSELKCIIATSIFDMGVDIPELNWVFLCAPTKSTVMILQRIGRSLRKTSKKTTVTIYAFEDIGDYFLSSASRRLKTVCKKEGFEVL